MMRKMMMMTMTRMMIMVKVSWSMTAYDFLTILLASGKGLVAFFLQFGWDCFVSEKSVHDQ